MNEVAIVVFWVLIGAAAVQIVPGLFYVCVVRTRRYPPMPDSELPKAVVLLGLRGHDPFLKDCIEGLVSQDYPCYDVWVMLDHPEDPAMQAVQAVLKEKQPANLHINVVTEHSNDCGLLNNNMVATVKELDDSYEVFALVDADVNPQSDWLRTLVAPLADERVGVACGNRWYMPSVATLGSLIRYVWNAAAVVQMYLNRFTWGGSLAMKAEVVRDTDLVESWSTALSLDTPIHNELRKTRLRAAFIPQMMMVNRESCHTRGFFRWVTRQMLIGRLYHPGWLPVLGHGLLTTLLIVAAIATLIAAASTSQWTALGWVAAGLAAYLVGLLVLLALLESAVRRAIKDRDEPTRWFTFATLLKLLLAVPLTQFVYAAALVRAVFIRSFEWRGVDYRLDKGGRLRMLEYRRFQVAEGAQESVESL